MSLQPTQIDRINSIKNVVEHMPSQIFDGDTLHKIVALVANDAEFYISESSSITDLLTVKSQLLAFQSRINDATDIKIIDNQDAIEKATMSLKALLHGINFELWCRMHQKFIGLTNPFNDQGEAFTSFELQRNRQKIMQIPFPGELGKDLISSIQHSQSNAYNELTTIIKLVKKVEQRVGLKMSELDYAVEQLIEATSLMTEAAQFLEALMNDTNIDLPAVIRENGILLSQQLAEAAGMNDEDDVSTQEPRHD